MWLGDSRKTEFNFHIKLKFWICYIVKRFVFVLRLGLYRRVNEKLVIYRMRRLQRVSWSSSILKLTLYTQNITLDWVEIAKIIDTYERKICLYEHVNGYIRRRNEIETVLFRSVNNTTENIEKESVKEFKNCQHTRWN